MSDTATITRSGPFWEFLAGRQPAPPAAETLGWELSWVAPQKSEIEVFFDARADFANPMGNVQGGYRCHARRHARITGTGRVVHRGRSIAFLAGNCATRPATYSPPPQPRSGSSARTDTDTAPGDLIVTDAGLKERYPTARRPARASQGRSGALPAGRARASGNTVSQIPPITAASPTRRVG